jgi:hypothetical protein
MAAVNDDDGRVPSPKELLALRRRAAYQEEKERRARDPKHLALKEAARHARRVAYQKAKARRKVEAEKVKARKKAEQAERRQAERADADRELWKLVAAAPKGSSGRQ